MRRNLRLMRVRLLILWLVLMALALPAAAENSLRLSADRLTVGDWLTIETQDGGGQRVYALYRDGEQINTGRETTVRQAKLYAREAGAYRLTVTPDKGPAMTAEFTVYDPPAVTLSMDRTELKAGEALKVTARVTGGAPDMTCRLDAWYGTERVFSTEGSQTEWQYTPYREGKLTLSVAVTDGLGKTASASADVLVSGTGGVTVRGNLGPVLAQGEIRTLTILSAGPWNAETEGEGLTLFNACGTGGDPLTFAMDATAGERTASILVHCMGLTRRITIRQSEESEEEAELYLFEEVRDRAAVDGQAAASWLCPAAGGSRMVDITASDEWTFEAQGKGLHVQREGNQLALQMDENSTADCRNAAVYIHCGEALAVMGVAQPGADRGASVREVMLNTDRGSAYQDEIAAQVLTDASAERLLLIIDGRSPLVYGLAEAEPQTDGLRWRIRVPLTGAGAQSWLFRAENVLGSAGQALATISVTPEGAGLTGTAARTPDGDAVTVWATAMTSKIETLDADGKRLRTYTVGTARVDRAQDATGRYALWTLPVDAEHRPDAVRAGDQTVKVQWSFSADTSKKEDSKPGFILYSQMDGTWHNQGYRHSTLEQSGCAIFALSHALQKLGYQEEEILPERLAVTYATCLVEGGTINSNLVGRAAKQFGYKTRFDLYVKKADIVQKYKQGSVFSFAIVKGHIAMTDRLSEDGTMCHIIDSAPGATFRRIKGASPMRYDEKTGKYVAMASPADIPGAVYYVDTEDYGGAEYWLPLAYVVDRGVRLIQPVK